MTTQAARPWTPDTASGPLCECGHGRRDHRRRALSCVMCSTCAAWAPIPDGACVCLHVHRPGEPCSREAKDGRRKCMCLRHHTTEWRSK